MHNPVCFYFVFFQSLLNMATYADSESRSTHLRFLLYMPCYILLFYYLSGTCAFWSSFRVNGVGSPLKEAHIAQMNELVRQQTDEWSKLKGSQMNELHTRILAFMDTRKELLLKVGIFGCLPPLLISFK